MDGNTARAENSAASVTTCFSAEVVRQAVPAPFPRTLAADAAAFALDPCPAA